MRQNIAIKSSPHGISIHVKKEVTMEELLQEIAEKFEAGRSFFGFARVTLTLSGAELDTEQENAVLETILEHSDLQVFALNEAVIQEEITEKTVEEEPPVPVRLDPDKAKIHYGNVKTDSLLDVPGSVLIFGDINPGGKVVADGDVILFGTCMGEIHAGLDGEADHFILAFGIESDRVRIGSSRYHRKKEHHFFKENAATCKLLYVQGSELKMEPFSKQLLSKFV